MRLQRLRENSLWDENRVPQALKRGRIFSDIVARVELVPFPNTFQTEFFRNHFRRCGPLAGRQTEIANSFHWME